MLTVKKFGAAWCGPCKMLKPVLAELEAEYTDVTFEDIDIDEQEELAKEFGVMSVPTTFFVKDGEIVDKMVGYNVKDAFAARIEEHK